MLKIKSEQTNSTNIVLTIYGQPGIGKTSLACSAERPIMFDFDNGIKRAYRKCPVADIEKTSDLINIERDDIAPYQTIIIDTVGKMIDKMIIEMPSYESKTQLKTASGAPTLQGYGFIKTKFAQILSKMTGFGKDVVLIAHAKEEKDGDSTIIRPEIVGSSLYEVVKASDQLGYFYSSQNKKRVIDFTPSANFYGKDSASIGKIVIDQDDDKCAEIIQKVKDAFSKRETRNKEEIEKQEKAKKLISHANDAESLNEIKEEIKTLDINQATKSFLFKDMIKRANDIGCLWDRDTKTFKEVEK